MTAHLGQIALEAARRLLAIKEPEARVWATDCTGVAHPARARASSINGRRQLRVAAPGQRYVVVCADRELVGACRVRLPAHIHQEHLGELNRAPLRAVRARCALAPIRRAGPAGRLPRRTAASQIQVENCVLGARPSGRRQVQHQFLLVAPAHATTFLTPLTHLLGKSKQRIRGGHFAAGGIADPCPRGPPSVCRLVLQGQNLEQTSRAREEICGHIDRRRCFEGSHSLRLEFPPGAIQSATRTLAVRVVVAPQPRRHLLDA